ncbi:hypothetical protein [Colwellia sp. E2M01]|nr:hypothetical protein [Colwellia sp. E2M01]
MKVIVGNIKSTITNMLSIKRTFKEFKKVVVLSLKKEKVVANKISPDQKS